MPLLSGDNFWAFKAPKSRPNVNKLEAKTLLFLVLHLGLITELRNDFDVL